MRKIVGYNNNNNNDNNNFHYICLVKDIPSGKSRSFSISNEKGTKIEIALFNIDRKYYAISNTCKHEGGPLSQGILKGKIVTCPWHGWKYSVIDGKAPHKGGDSVESYETKVINEELYVNSIPICLAKQVIELQN
jgi:nitrite reductase/ring-hydroxylating ferredoxin subunit